MRRSCILAVALLTAGAGAAQATTVRKLNLQEKTKVADVIVHARVLELTPRWNADHSGIYTEVTLQPIEQLKGPAQARVVIRAPGGGVDGFHTSISGAHRYQVGEEVVLFLERYKDTLIAVGVGIGTYEVKPASGTPTVFFAPNVAEAQQTASGRFEVSPRSADAPIPLATFKQKIRALVAR